MQVLFELLLRILFEVVAYATGKGFVILFLPHLRMEPLHEQESMPHWKWRGFTYERNSRTFLFTETIQLIGLVVVLVLVICSFLIVRYAHMG